MTDCWLWAKCITYNGYGIITVSENGRSKTFGAHRVMYEDTKGEIPKGLVIDHLCRVRHCVNPDHLEAITQGENLLRGVKNNAHKTHCAEGHEYTPENTFIRKGVNAGARTCRTCRRTWVKGQRQRRIKRQNS